MKDFGIQIGRTNNVSKIFINPHLPSSRTCNMLQMTDHSKKLTPYLLQNYVALYFGSYWKQANVAVINFWDFNTLNDWA